MPRPGRSKPVGLYLSAAVVLFALGCSSDSSPRSTVTVDSINSNALLTSDVHNNGNDQLFGTDDDFIVEDQVPLVLRNRPHDPGLNIVANGPFGAVVFNRYEVRFQGDETLPPLYGGFHLRVLSGSTIQGEVVVVPASYKTVPPLSTLLSQGGELRFTAEVTLIGEEEDSNDEVRVVATLPVHCANWGDR